ncbi:MAG: helix-turn-helix domain-containing protein [Actinomycetota bacterium]|nr:helix-turn-helix domain-containing protein [Actinomycetota bacterium]
MHQLGPRIEGARTRLALSQGALASLLGVSQQTVSRWEQGIARPRAKLIAKLADVLNLDVAALTAAAGEATSRNRTDGPVDDTAPRRPLTPMLPFQRLEAEEFERVVADLMERRYPGAKVSQLGGQGDDQRGFDVLIVQPDGHRIAVQCKRMKQFGPKKVREAVEAAELDVDESFIALARVATAEARFELDKHAGWQLWDAADLSRQVRLLDIEAAHQVVRTYFPGHVEAFLDIKPATPWRTAAAYYRSSSHTLLDHRQALVGRARLVDDVVRWILDPDEAGIAMVIGRGGLGKSKLLWEVASRVEGADVHLRFLAVGQQPVADDFDALPRTGSLVVVLDDAHAIDRIAGIISQLWHCRPRARVLLAARPYGRVELDAEIWRLNQAPRTAKRWELDDLTQAEAAELVASLTSRSPGDSFTQQLAAVSRDCPFIAVVAADLYRRGEMAGRTFASDSALRSDVFRRFADQMTGTSGGSDAAERRSVLEALAIFQPVRLDDRDFKAAIGDLTGIASWDMVNGRIQELEDADLVLRRGGTAVRVIPDMFADVLVSNAAFDDRSGLRTEFLSRAQRGANGASLQHLLINASRIDWQVRDGRPGRADIVNDLWAALHDQLLSGSFDEQLSLLKLVSRSAYFQPDLALCLIDAILAADKNDSGPADPAANRWAATRTDVVHATVPVLRNVAYHPEFLRPTLDRLWALAQEDTRPTNQHPEHPLRVLRGIADLHTGKPFAYINAVIDAAADWLTTPSSLSPFEVIEPILAVEGSDEVSSEMKLTFHPFGIDPVSVRPVRQRVVDLAFTQAESSDIPSAVRAINMLGQAIRGPSGMFNRQPTDDEQNGWAIEFLPIIERLGQLGANPDRDPAIRVAIREVLNWHADHSQTATKEAARIALADLVTTIEDELAACLHDGWSQLTIQAGLSFEEAARPQRSEFSRVTAAISGGRRDEEILNRLEHRLRIERMVSERIDGAAPFIAYFLASRPSAASLLCDRALAGDLPELARFAGNAIGILAVAGDAATIAFASSMLAADDPKLQWGGASGLSWNRAGRIGLLSGEDDVLAAMAAHGNDVVRVTAGRAAFAIGMSNTAAAFALLAKIEFRGCGPVAAAALSGFLPQGPLSWSDTAPRLRTSVLGQIIDLRSIDEYEILGALSELSLIDPLCVTRLLMQRLDRQTEVRSADYSALPHHWSPALRIQQTADLSRCLEEIRDWVTHRGPEERRYRLQDDGAELYQQVAGDWNDQALATLSDFGDAPTEAALVTAARLLANAPAAVLFAQVPMVTKLLHSAESLGRDSAELVLRALLTANGVFSRWIGEISEAEQQELNQARRIVEALPRGSVERRFFGQLAERIELQLSWTTDFPHPQNDGREW